MACGGEPNPTFAQIAERAADLCEVAEKYAPDPSKLFYIIGTEVPTPGGETEEPNTLDVTSVARFHDTIQTHRDAWNTRGLDAAWDRVVSVVTQPGVDFGHTSVYPFLPVKAAPLREAIIDEVGLTYEAHSTDYQSTNALSDLVKNHFFFLKVGPELTFRFREAIWALAQIEEEIINDPKSLIRETFEQQMTKDPGYWVNYYNGSDKELRILRTYSYSDRIRYYWTDPEISKSLNLLIANLEQVNLPESIVSQAFMGLDFGEVPETPLALIELHIQRCISRYFKAAGH
jgi:D-tagatose-1,6-bisphosphate aldolase subunit GatZ/KbaZ